jgi:hypothetical protein
MRRELDIIRDELHANAVRLGGRDVRRLLAADCAAGTGLDVWLGPELWNATPAAHAVSGRRLGAERGLSCPGALLPGRPLPCVGVAQGADLGSVVTYLVERAGDEPGGRVRGARREAWTAWLAPSGRGSWGWPASFLPPRSRREFDCGRRVAGLVSAHAARRAYERGVGGRRLGRGDRPARGGRYRGPPGSAVTRRAPVPFMRLAAVAFSSCIPRCRHRMVSPRPGCLPTSTGGCR